MLGRGPGDASENSSLAFFTKDTATKTGRTQRSVQIEAKRGDVLGTDTLTKVIGTTPDKSEELDRKPQACTQR